MFTAAELIQLIPRKIYNHINFLQTESEKFGQSIYLVGGCVRDLVMKKVPHDYDFTTSLTPENIKKIFKRVIETGIKHGTVTVLIEDQSYEITTYRKEQGYSDGRRPDSVEFGTSLEEDVLRRDFTMNALALDIKGEKIFDFTNGIVDIHKKIIRTIGNPIDRFSEDGLRPIRCIRFMSTLDFTIEENTYNALKKTQEITKKISVERFKDELFKILSSNHPSNGIRELHKLDYFQLFTSVSLLEFSIKSNLSLESISSKYPIARLAIVLIYLFGYDSLSQNNMGKFLKEIKFSNDQIKLANFYVYLILKYNKIILNWHHFGSTEKKVVRKIISEYLQQFNQTKNLTPNLEAIPELISYIQNTILPGEILEEIEDIFLKNYPLTLKDLKIDGTEMKALFPGIEQRVYGEILRKCLEHVVEFPEMNNQVDLVNFIRKIPLS